MFIYKLRALNTSGIWHESFFVTQGLAYEYYRRAVVAGDFEDKFTSYEIIQVWLCEEI